MGARWGSGMIDPTVTQPWKAGFLHAWQMDSKELPGEPRGFWRKIIQRCWIHWRPRLQNFRTSSTLLTLMKVDRWTWRSFSRRAFGNLLDFYQTPPFLPPWVVFPCKEILFLETDSEASDVFCWYFNEFLMYVCLLNLFNYSNYLNRQCWWFLMIWSRLIQARDKAIFEEKMKSRGQVQRFGAFASGVTPPVENFLQRTKALGLCVLVGIVSWSRFGLMPKVQKDVGVCWDW